MRAIRNLQVVSCGSVAASPRSLQRGFTLIELLVVIAITSLLLTLVLAPLVQSYNLSSRAGTTIEAQVAARDTMREINRVLSNAAFVFDNSRPNSSLNIWLTDRSGAPIVESLQYGLVEYVAAGRQLDQQPGGAPEDPTTGQKIYDPTRPIESGFALPLTPGRVLGRLFIGLQQNTAVSDTHSINTAANALDRRFNGMPAVVYSNRFTEPNVSNDNRYTLYKAETVTTIPDPADNTRFIPNLRLFHSRNASGNLVDTKYTNNVPNVPELHDPNFFYDNSLAGGNESDAGNPNPWAVPGWKDLNNDGRVQVCENWRAISATLLPLNKADAIALERDDRGGILYYDTGGSPTLGDSGRPRIRPLVSFAPTYVENDPGVPTALESTGNESPNPAPTTYKSHSTHWAVPFRVFVYRGQTNRDDPMANNPLTYYMTTGDGRIAQATSAPGAAPPNPNNLPDVGPMLDPQYGIFTNPAQTLFAFTVDSEKGLINFAFPSSVMIHETSPPYARRGQMYSPADINAQLTALPGSWEKRFLSLRELPTTQWGGMPLNPTGLISPLSPATNWANTVRIVPGSEQVFGPDQRPGPNYGRRVLYARVSANAGAIGLNEYKINYEDIRNISNPNDPRQRIGYIEFNSIPDTTDPLNPNNPNGGPNSLPVQKVNPATGLLDPSLPADPVEVYYSFQMNRPNDVVKIDYLTRELMNVTMEARLFDPASGAAQTTALAQKVKVRNLPR